MKKLMVLLFCFFIVVCAGCKNTATEPIVYEYAMQKISYADGSFSFQREMDCLQTPKAHYYFDSSVADSDRRSCVEATEQILSHFSEQNAVLSICVLEIDDTYIESNTLFLSPQDWRSVDYATKVLLAISGQCSHYGLAYGYANWLCDGFEWPGSYEGAFATTDDTEIYDLNYLCFDNRFTSEDNISSVRFVAVDFVSNCITEIGEDAFQQLVLNSDTAAGMNHVVNALTQYYQSNGQNIEVSDVRYGFGGVSNDYIVSSDFGTFYIGKEWVDQFIDYNSAISANFLHEQYGEIREFFTINLQQMAQYQELFGLDSYDNNLTVIFTNSTTYGGAASEYRSNGHTIYLKSIMDMTHEYIHALTIPSATRDLETWEYEGFATYFSVWYDFYSRDFLNNDYNSLSTLAPLREKLGRPLDVLTDNDDILNYVVIAKKWVDPNVNYWSGASFVGYLVNQYGLDNVVQHICGVGDSLPKSVGSLVQEWKDYLENAY